MQKEDPIKSVGGKKSYALLFLIIAVFPAYFFFFPGPSGAVKIPVLENAGACMGCHSSREFTKTFRNKEKMSVFVDAKDFRNSVHRSLSCTDCHGKISLDKHPGNSGIYENRAAFTAAMASGCRKCHSDNQLRAKGNHAYVAEKADVPLCTECHGGHNVLRVSEWKSSLRGNEYCLLCHSRNISKIFGSGERLSLLIDPSNLASSVHNKHDCSHCHAEYTRDSHPIRAYEGSREHSVAVSGICRRCHEDKYALMKGSIHYNLSFLAGETLISRGSPKAPVCTDCHGFHTVGPRATYETVSGVPCRKCHEDIFRIYSTSVHGMARANGEHKAPLCASCHFAHEINFTGMTDKIKGSCLGCHEGVEARHKKWLPNAELHLSVIACAACHAPTSKKGIYLQLIDKNTGKPFTRGQILQLLGTTSEELSARLDTHGRGLDSYELSYILKQLNDKGGEAQVTYLGRMDVEKYSEAHQLSLKKYAIRECESCHSKGSKFFNRVTLAVVRTEGGIERYPIAPDVLTSIGSTLTSRQFYVLGGTRIALLDWAGILVVFCGILFPVAHITIRVLTAPMRKAGKSREQGRGKGQ